MSWKNNRSFDSKLGTQVRQCPISRLFDSSNFKTGPWFVSRIYSWEDEIHNPRKKNSMCIMDCVPIPIFAQVVCGRSIGWPFVILYNTYVLCIITNISYKGSHIPQGWVTLDFLPLNIILVLVQKSTVNGKAMSYSINSHHFPCTVHLTNVCLLQSGFIAFPLKIS